MPWPQEPHQQDAPSRREAQAGSEEATSVIYSSRLSTQDAQMVGGEKTREIRGYQRFSFMRGGGLELPSRRVASDQFPWIPGFLFPLVPVTNAVIRLFQPRQPLEPKAARNQIEVKSGTNAASATRCAPVGTFDE